ncbi:MAG TPA: hypothetical protein VF411_14770 [Bacteroidia bacterium]
MKRRKSAMVFNMLMSMADRFNVSDDNKNRLIIILNEQLEDLDFIAISDQQQRILSVLGISSEKYGEIFMEEWKKAIAQDLIMSN